MKPKNPALESEILRLRLETDLPQYEIAEQLGTTEAEVHKTLRRHKLAARQILKRRVEMAREMAAQGKLSVEIRQAMGISAELFSRWKKEYGIECENGINFASIPETEVGRIREMVEAGTKQWDIAREYGVQQSTISRYCQTHKIEVPKREKRPRQTK